MVFDTILLVDWQLDILVFYDFCLDLQLEIQVFDVILELIGSPKFWYFTIFELSRARNSVFFHTIFELIYSSKFRYDMILELI